MALYQTHPQTETTPAEYESDDLQRCAICREEDDADNMRVIAGDYCCDTYDCRRALQREAIAFRVLQGLSDIERRVQADFADEPMIDTDDMDDPMYILADLKKRMTRIEGGEDSGWRNEVMLDDDDYITMLSRLQVICTSMGVATKVAMEHPGYRPELLYPDHMQQLGWLAGIVLRLKAARQLTENGGEMAKKAGER